MFDSLEIVVKAGHGGDGAISFRHEKYAPFGGPDGGDGGVGGNIVIIADPGILNLRAYKGKRLYVASPGQNGHGRKKHGKNGDDLLLKVPVGTIAIDMVRTGEAEIIADLEEPGEKVVIARGGKGGLGNTHFASSTNQAPRIAQKGQQGEGKTIILEMMLIADVGIIGYPNVGKSTLLTAASAAKPKIASYPFTTLEPILGVVEIEDESFVLAEIPGLVDNAHLGRGLGHDFLRHAMRTKMLIHLIDGNSISPIEDMIRINTELSLYDTVLAAKPQLMAVNKADLPQVQSRIGEIKNSFNDAGTQVFFVSAASGEGVDKLMSEAMKIVRRITAEMKERRRAPEKVFRPQPRTATVTVHKEEDTFVVIAPGLERIVARIDMSSADVRQQLQAQMVRMGVSRVLEKAGIKPGDKVRCGSFEWVW